jgi:phosphotriesterase-related protein
MTTLIDSVSGPISSDSLGLTLTHEHLANSIAEGGGTEPDPDYPELYDQPVSASNAWLIRERPYSNLDNNVLDDDEGMVEELRAFRNVGGTTIIETTPMGQGRSAARVKRMAERSGAQVIMGGGWYLEQFQPDAAADWSIDRMADEMMLQYRPESADAGVVAGIIGEIGISPDRTERELRALRAACAVQLEVRKPLMVHLPFRQFGHEVLDIVLDEFGVEPRAVVLAHMDWGDTDPHYQRSLAERGVVLEFDMIGMPFLYPMEGQSPLPGQTAEAIARLVDAGHGDRILLSHDLFLKTMMRKHGGNGLVYVPTLFAGRLRAAGIDPEIVQAMMTANPRALFEHAAG